MIPSRFLHKIGGYTINTGDDSVDVKVVDNELALNDLGVLPSYKPVPIIGLDIKRLTCSSSSSTFSSPYDLLILCWPTRCWDSTKVPKPEPFSGLIIQLRYMSNGVPEKVKKLLTDTYICFVTPTSLPSPYDLRNSIQVGDLASRVLKKQDLLFSGLGDISRQVGVPYDGVNASLSKLGGVVDIHTDQKNMRVLSDAQVKTAVTEAYTCYKIASKLLS